MVEVYYDRIYSLMLFDLDGGYGVEPIYARYGTPIGDVGTPTKAGYTFKGWSEDGTTVVDLPDEMPAGNKTYKALWQPDNTAKVTIVFWGENADDEEYSYLDSAEVNVKPGTEFTYSEDGFLICGQEEHTHDDTCYTCGQSSHTHSTDCYAGVGSLGNPKFAPPNPKNGQIYSGSIGVVSWSYIYINGQWYNYTGNVGDGQVAPTICGKTESTHTHTDACLGCGKTEHTHTSSCYVGGAGLDAGLWKFVRSDTVTVAADGSSVVNVYYDRVEYTVNFYTRGNSPSEYTDLRITAKWGASILDQWPTYNSSSSWYVSTSGNTWQNSLQIMPVGGEDFYGPKTGNSNYTAYYYVEALPGDTDTITHNGVTYKLHHTDVSVSSGNVTDEERYEIKGFTYKEGTANGQSFNNAKFYYTRNSYYLTFSDGFNEVKQDKVKYQALLSTYADYVPDVPSAYEPDSVVFGGWYLNPECSGAEYKLSEHTMPDTNILLYAKWVPVIHTVAFYLDKAALEAGTKLGTHPERTVSHGSLVDPAPADPANGSYTFVGWFYLDNGVEKAFDFANMPVNKDLKVYGKWSSNTLMEYTISYKLQGTDTEIAAPTTGSGLAGVTKTFEAKGGADLYDGYQEGYFPVVKSHSLTIDIDDPTKNIFTFEYIQKDAVPYTVKYINTETNTNVFDGVTVADKVESENRKAVVTETFKPIPGYMPDAYQKRLVVSAEEGAVNEIIFYYTEDTTHAYYKITHYTQNTDGATWTEYASSQAVGDIGTTYTADPLTIPGFTYDSTVEGTVASGELTAGGLELKLYYIRNEYPYQVRYLEQGTGKPLANPKDGKGRYGAVISEAAIPIEDYDLVTSTPQTLNIRIEESQTEAKLNVITFYYQEQDVTIQYQVVGPDGCGTVTLASETVKVLSGTAIGSTATASSEEYRFVGWYSDAACTTRVSADSKYVPEKVAGKNVAATYYAKFEPNQGSLTIEKTVKGGVEQDFVFDVTGGGKTYTVVISCGADGKGSTTIQGLTAGSYTVAERTGWSWKYECTNGASKDVTVPGGGAGTVSFTNEKTSNWFGASDKVDNVFDVVTTDQAQNIQPAALPEKKLELNGEEV